MLLPVVLVAAAVVIMFAATLVSGVGRGVALASAEPESQKVQPAPTVSNSPSPSASATPTDTVAPRTIARGADENWHRLAVTVTFLATDEGSGVASTQFALDDGPWQTGTEVVVPAPRSHANDGVHTLAYRSVDYAGNYESEQYARVQIDTKPPSVKWLGVSPSVLHKVQSVRLSFRISDASGSPVKVQWQAVDQYGYIANTRGGYARTPGSVSISLSPRYKNGKPFTPGLYRINLRLVDEAGNVANSKTRIVRNYRSTQARVWRRVSGAGRRVALTFDDSGAAAWRSILNTLKRYRAHATFFPLGPAVAASPDLARRTVAEGHAIGSHGWTHRLMTYESSGGIATELWRSAAPWWSSSRATPVPYVRPPYGGYNSATVAACGAQGFERVILWDVDPQDWASPGASVIAARVLSHVKPGSIVVLHLRSQTAAALPAILRGLEARGYKAVSLPELFRAAGYR
mgnify:FL=1